MENNSPNADADHRVPLGRPLCREPWQNYYILRRGIMPCCHGHKAITPMSGWESAWNCVELQEIRAHLAKGELSPYCLMSLSCPIVRRYLEDHPEAAVVSQEAPKRQPETPPRKRPLAWRLANRALGGVPGRIYGRLRKGTSA